MEQTTRQVVIALGANLGNAEETLRAAACRIGDIPSLTIISASCIYQSQPAYLEEQAQFSNAILLAKCDLEPLVLLHELQAIEQEFGRKRTIANGPRSLDLDIVDITDVIRETQELTLPHPLALERGFVVTPLLEIAPEYRFANGKLVTEADVEYGEIISKGPSLIECCADSEGITGAGEDEITAIEVAHKTAGRGTLSVCSTPIGNLGDITLRVIETLGRADLILAEDTRVTLRLLNHLQISTRLERCDENVIKQRMAAILVELQQGKHVAFVSDAGTPGVADPGMQLIAAVREAGYEVEVLPGASAVLTALVASGFEAPGFYFGGFIPRKAKAAFELFGQLAHLNAVLVFYESPHRTAKSLERIAEAFPQREVVMARELTKLHEEVLRGSVAKIAEQISNRTEERPLKGEVVLVIGPPQHSESEARVHRDKYADMKT